MDLNIAGKSFVVTGGTSGLGFATAQSLAEEGGRVIVNGRAQSRVDLAVAKLGANARGISGDIAEEITTSKILMASREAGQLAGALISVGGPPRGSVMQTSLTTWEEQFHKVFLGTLRMMKALVPEMAPGGAIAVVLSSSVKSPIPNLAVSNGLRPGLAMLVKDLADEIGPQGIRVFGLMPGRIKTSRTDEVDGEDPEVRRRTVEAIPLKRLGEPEEFGRVSAFLLSPRASYVTGCVIPVDGGMIRSL